MVPELWSTPLWEKVWPYVDLWDSVRLRTASTHWNVPRKYGPHSELFFFLMKKEQVVASNEVLPNTCVSAETLKACALIGLHIVAILGDMWRHGCPMSPEWFSSCSTSVTSCGGGEYEHNNGCLAIQVVGQDWYWELGRVALSCHMAMDLLCQEMRDPCWVSSE